MCHARHVALQVLHWTRQYVSRPPCDTAGATLDTPEDEGSRCPGDPRRMRRSPLNPLSHTSYKSALATDLTCATVCGPPSTHYDHQ
ncbi:hypothetical protein J6590_027578 [Homalodisca vitripennis]|nr:hypothetical protein J6590_027578 [Homalodisca vitripennis]